MAASIRSLLESATARLRAASDSPALDADILMCFVIKKDRAHLKAWPEKILPSGQREEYGRLIEKRLAGHPVAYLTGSREFWSRNFIVTEDVLIPRPETELLVELALGAIPENAPYQLIDLGTGSGAVAVTLAAERPIAAVTATDISPAALDVAKKNADVHRTANIRLMRSSWFDDIPVSAFDLIVGNPPYIAADDPHLRQGDIRFEPQTALTSLDGGLRDIGLIVESARRYLKPGGRLMLEHGYDQQLPVQAIFKRCGYASIRTEADLAGNPRVTGGLWPG
ncbi:MAG: peptide chain release factor N(5)-glutamine methyltransferase [Gammaproteobacteria bacterium]